MRKQTQYREITWSDNPSNGQITITEYIKEMKKYGQEKARTVRTARRYLRSIGFEIDSKGKMTTPEK